MKSTELSSQEVNKLEEIVYSECETLDNGDYEAWFNLYDENADYWVPLLRGAKDPLSEPSIIYEHIDAMHIRTQRSMHPKAHGLEYPIHTSRVIGKIYCTKISNGNFVARANFHLMEEQAPDRQRIFGGDYVYTIIEVEEMWKISRKRVNLLNPQAPFEMIQIIL